MALPGLSLSTLVGGQVVNGVVALGATADSAGFASIQFQVSGQNVGTPITSGSCATSWDTRTFSNGQHTVAAVASDSLGNTVWTTPIVVTVSNVASNDTTAPTVSLTSPAAGSTVAGTTALSATASDNTGVAGVSFTVDGTVVGSEDSSAPYQFSWNSSTVPNGSHTIRAVARDAAGNTATSSAVTVTINNGTADTTSPTVSVSAPASGATVSGTVTITATASDNVGVANVQFILDGSDLGAQDATAPYSFSWNTAGVANGSHVIRAVAHDLAGNETNSAYVTVTVSNGTVDTTLPVVSMASPTAGATVSGTTSISATASDNVGVTAVQFLLDGAVLGSAATTSPYTISWVTSGTTNGSHILSAVARDAAGNTATSSAITVTVNNQSSDTSAPTVSLSAPSSNATVSGSVTVSATASDNVGVTSVQFTVDGTNIGSADTSSPYSVSWITSTVANGSHVLRAVARDAAGNVTTSSSRTVTVANNVDTSLPSVSLTAPSSGATVQGSVTVSASASDNVGVASVQFTVDGVDIGTDTAAPWATSWDTTTAANGSRTLRAIARDAAGNTRTSSSRSVTVNNTQPDTTAPSVALTAPASGATLGGTVAMAASASDNVAVVGVQFMLNGAAIGSEDTAAPYALNWTSTAVADGPYQITAVARDAAGNRRTSASITVAIANQAGNRVVGDFNGDGTPDLLFAHNTGTLYSWFMDGARMIGGAYIAPGTVPNGWQVVGIDDFNTDGKSDVIIQNQSTGQLTLWAMDGTTRIDTVALLSTTTPWRVSGTGDFDGDGQTDIVWQNPTTGQLYVWLMDGPNMIAEGYLSPAQTDTRWKIVGTADMNGDSRIDLVWQNFNSGELVVWQMNGLTATAVTKINPDKVNPSWRIKAVADFDLDGKADFIWQHTQLGTLYIWFMNGTRMVRDQFIVPAQVATSWQIVGGK